MIPETFFLFFFCFARGLQIAQHRFPIEGNAFHDMKKMKSETWWDVLCVSSPDSANLDGPPS